MFEKPISDLYRVTKGNDESLTDYVSKFGKEALVIPHLDVSIFMEAFKMGLKKDSPIYKDLCMTPCMKMDEVRNRALRFIRLEEDMKIQKRTNTSYDHPNRKNEYSFQKNPT